MNLKDVAKRMDKKKQYRWQVDGGTYLLIGEAGNRMYQTDEHLTAEIVSKKLRSMGYNIVGDVPVYKPIA